MDQQRISLKDIHFKQRSEIKFHGEIVVFDDEELLPNINIIVENKVFNCEKLIFENITNEDLLVDFYNCTFNCKIEFDTCIFKDLIFNSCNINSSTLVILNSNIDRLSFEENNKDIHNIKTNIVKNGTIEINGGKIENVNFENIVFENGNLKIINFDSIENCSIVRSTLNHVLISHCNFKSHFEYFGNKNASRVDAAFFNHCSFNHSNFFETTFNSNTKFSNCHFLNDTKFESLKSEIFIKIKFNDCEFLKSTTFNRALIHKLSFEKSVFLGQISLQEAYFDIIKIDRTIFESGAYFDDIQIKKINDCDRRTIRTIKQELQKKDNKIDYNRFRVYEFNAYRKDIKKQLVEIKKDKDSFRHRKREPIQLKRDLFVLNISEFVSEYGTDWKRALIFTLTTAFLFFTSFYILENFNLQIDINNWKEFMFGYLRFFLITDFKNEYYISGESILKFNFYISFLPFILGKIFIAFGIYEMIQSFRKFKA